MKPVTAPLETGTYLFLPDVQDGRFQVLHKDENGAKFELADTDHEGAKWHLQKIGLHRYMAKNVKHNHVAGHPNPDNINNAVFDIVEGPVEWIVEPTGDGTYIGSPASHPHLYGRTSEEGIVKIVPKSEATKWKVFLVDDD